MNTVLDVQSLNGLDNGSRGTSCQAPCWVAIPKTAELCSGLLESVERDSAQSQRRLAAELGIAVGLVNIYLRRCVNKGLLKMAQAPTRRYAYYLTPSGFAEKARLTLEYLSYSFDLFRRAKADCTTVLLARECARIS